MHAVLVLNVSIHSLTNITSNLLGTQVPQIYSSPMNASCSGHSLQHWIELATMASFVQNQHSKQIHFTNVFQALQLNVYAVFGSSLQYALFSKTSLKDNWSLCWETNFYYYMFLFTHACKYI